MMCVNYFPWGPNVKVTDLLSMHYDERESLKISYLVDYWFNNPLMGRKSVPAANKKPPRNTVDTCMDLSHRSQSPARTDTEPFLKLFL